MRERTNKSGKILRYTGNLYLQRFRCCSRREQTSNKIVAKMIEKGILWWLWVVLGGLRSFLVLVLTSFSCLCRGNCIADYTLHFIFFVLDIFQSVFGHLDTSRPVADSPQGLEDRLNTTVLSSKANRTVEAYNRAFRK